MMSLSSTLSKPWLLIGDFNQVCKSDEKVSNNLSLPGGNDFLNAINHCHLIDIKHSGIWFTWCNGRKGLHCVWERLDRALISQDWLDSFQDFNVESLPIIASDHGPLIASTKKTIPFRHRPRRFEAMWAKHPDCGNIIQSAWNSHQHGSTTFSVARKIQNSMDSLLDWNKNSLGNIQVHISSLNSLLSNLQFDVHDLNSELHSTKIDCRTKLGHLLEMEELIWAQKDRQLWLVGGDRNTKYFHSIVKKRRVYGRILKIKNDDGDWITNYSDMEMHMIEFFQKAYSSNPDDPPVDYILDELDGFNVPCLTEAQCWNLSRNISEDEVHTTLFQMKGFKALGPDGLPPGIFQQNWDTVKSNLTRMIDSFFRNGHLLKEFNHTYITLIPKVSIPSFMKDFHPICLCNFVYKIISKIVANRIKPFIDILIDPDQIAFIKGRKISDSIFLASKIMSFIHKAEKHKTNWCALKLDMAKAFDRLSRNFIKVVLIKMNFPLPCINVIWQCITTVRYTLLLNQWSQS